MKIRFVWVGKTRDPRYDALEREYVKRLRRFADVESLAVPESLKKDKRQVASQLRKEATRIDSATADARFRILMDERGTTVTSHAFARLLRDLEERALSPVSFVVGGFHGLPDGVRQTADKVLSLSELTLPHELARVVLLEQVYRGFTIARGIPYHQ